MFENRKAESWKMEKQRDGGWRCQLWGKGVELLRTVQKEAN